jgi:hypothetical protein
MSLRSRKEERPLPGFSLLSSGGVAIPAPTAAQAGLSFNIADVGAPLRTVAPSPYNDKAHLEPREFEDHDGGPWAETPNVRPKFQSVPQKWVVAPSLGSAAPAICVFPRRLSNNISFAPDVHLSFSACWTPIIARFTNLFLTDVDKKGNMPEKAQQQHWLVTFKGKTATSLTSVVLRIRVNNQGDQLEGWALYLPDTDFVQSFIDFPPPPAAQVGFDSSTAVVVNGALSAYDPNTVEVVFSKLDESVERERRIERARQAWGLFVQDIKLRSNATIESINFIRKQTYYSHFRGRERNGEHNVHVTKHSAPCLKQVSNTPSFLCSQLTFGKWTRSVRPSRAGNGTGASPPVAKTWPVPRSRWEGCV